MTLFKEVTKGIMRSGHFQVVFESDGISNTKGGIKNNIRVYDLTNGRIELTILEM